MNRLSVLITGSSSGFGYAIAQRLAAAGHRVFASMRDLRGRNAAAAASLEAWAAEAGADLRPLELDVTCDTSVSAALAEIARTGELDVVVHNAGVAAMGLVESQSVALAARIFEVNVMGPLRVQQAALPLLRASRSARIVAISSTLGRERVPFLALYTATKHALDAMLTTWAYELHPEGIRTVLVEPGTIPTTRMLDNLLEGTLPHSPTAAPLAARARGLADGLRAWGKAPDAPAAALVADAVLRALAPDAPARIVVDPSGFDGCARMDAMGDAVQRELLARYGMDDLTDPSTAP
jgi:NAD(P)-dependent dehydrogenase (short-subunit alcohol dehydrogenase family)